jgi:hypothetical protein
MQCVSRLISIGAFSLALGLGGVPVGHAWEPQDQTVPAFVLPSDATSVAGTNQFLTFTDDGPPSLDNAISACAYYLAISAVTGCDAAGNFVAPTTFEKWKSDVKIDKYAINGQTTDIAHFINKTDLNLTRDHHMISYGPNQLAGYVCNHAGPQPTVADPTGLFPSQAEIDQLIGTIKRHQNLIACVAMEYSVDVVYTGAASSTGVPYTRFWIFIPDPTNMSNELVLSASVDLDQRGQKFVPGVCTACHGGPFTYQVLSNGAHSFPVGTTASGNLSAHFLPFDMANFDFSQRDLNSDSATDKIFALNLNVYNTENTRTTAAAAADPTHTILASPGSDSIVQLIAGWYNQNVTKANTAPTFNNPPFTAPAWQDTAAHQTVYQSVIAHSCRTCHAAMDNDAFELTGGPATVQGLGHILVCGGTTPRSHAMPNSLVTFNRFWLSNLTGMVPGQPDTAPAQPMILNSMLFGATTCDPPT